MVGQSLLTVACSCEHIGSHWSSVDQAELQTDVGRSGFPWFSFAVELHGFVGNPITGVWADSIHILKTSSSTLAFGCPFIQ
jgi:hypothetical protein